MYLFANMLTTKWVNHVTEKLSYVRSLHLNRNMRAAIVLVLCFLSAVSSLQLNMGLKVGQPFPAPALKKFGVAGKPAVVYFYGADESPSCTKQCAAFNGALDDFKKLKVDVVGVRNEKVSRAHS